MIKYAKEHTDKTALSIAKKYRLDLIEIPEEYRNMEEEY